MPSAADVFLAVNGSGRAVRSLFIPVCAAVLLSPFAATLYEYSGMSNHMFPLPPFLTVLPSIVVAFVALVINTRIGTSRDAVSEEHNGIKSVPRIPYWVIGLGHFLEVSLFGGAFLRRLRDNAKDTIFALYLGGEKHNVVCDPSLIASFHSQDDGTIASEPLTSIALRNAFDIRGVSEKSFDGIHGSAVKVLSKYLLADDHLDKIVKVTTNNYRDNLPHLVSFVDSLVDQTAWERVSGVVVSEGSKSGQEVEVSLMSLVQAFVGFNSLPAFTGVALAESYPEFLSDLWTLNSNYFILALGLPRWFPLPGIVPIHLARKRLLAQISSFNHALDLSAEGKDPGSTYRDVSDVSAAYVELQSTLKGQPPEVRNGLSLYAIWALSASSTLLSFWTLLRISSQGSVSELRAEIAKYATVKQAPPTMGFSEPPRLTLDVEGLIKKCPLLKSSFVETARLDSHPWVCKKALKDLTLESSGGLTSFGIDEGEYVDLAYSLHHSDPKVFPSPDDFRPSRHLEGDKNSGKGFVSPLGTSPLDRNVSRLAERQCLAFVAGVLALWDIEHVGAGWKIPKKKRGANVDVPNGEIRVKIRRRGE